MENEKVKAEVRQREVSESGDGGKREKAVLDNLS